MRHCEALGDTEALGGTETLGTEALRHCETLGTRDHLQQSALKMVPSASLLIPYAAAAPTYSSGRSVSTSRKHAIDAVAI